jgi:hypothetical protein
MAQVDIAAVFQLLGTVAADMREMKADMREVKAQLCEHDHKIDEVASGVSSLRAALTEYHSAVVGHGVLIGDLEDRVRRIERHLGFAPAAE